jgi:hypothetical protein
MCHARLASYRTSSPHGLVCSQRLLNKLSTRREPGDRIPHSVLPPAEMGTAQQENPVATVNTVHTLQLTTEELYMLARAMQTHNEPTYPDIEACYPSLEAVALEKLLFSAVPLEN